MKNIFLASHLWFAFLMFTTLFASTIGRATIIIAMTGITWGIQMWAPFTMIGEFLASRKGQSRTELHLPISEDVTFGSPHQTLARRGSVSGHQGEIEDDDGLPNMAITVSKQSPYRHLDTKRDRQVSVAVLPVTNDSTLTLPSCSAPSGDQGVNCNTSMDAPLLHSDPFGRTALTEVEGMPGDEEEDLKEELQAGVVVGVHNMYVVFPQFVMTAVAAVAFSAYTATTTQISHYQQEIPPTEDVDLVGDGAVGLGVAPRWSERYCCRCSVALDYRAKTITGKQGLHPPRRNGPLISS